MVAHGYVDTSGAFVSGDAVSGAAVWDDIVKLHSNVVAVLCGHYSGEYEGTSTGVAGNTVYNLLTDYQDEPDGGDGWLRLYEFYPLQDKVQAVTYSPYLDAVSDRRRQPIRSPTGAGLCTWSPSSATARRTPPSSRRPALRSPRRRTRRGRGGASQAGTQMPPAPRRCPSPTPSPGTRPCTRRGATSPPPTTPPAGWSNDPVTVHFTASDSATGRVIDHTDVQRGRRRLDRPATASPCSRRSTTPATASTPSSTARSTPTATRRPTQELPGEDRHRRSAGQRRGARRGRHATPPTAPSTVAWSAADPGDAQHASGLEVQEARIDGASDNTVAKGATLGSLSLSAGGHTFTLVVTDAAGNETDVSNEFTVLDAGSGAPVTDRRRPRRVAERAGHGALHASTGSPRSASTTPSTSVDGHGLGDGHQRHASPRRPITATTASTPSGTTRSTRTARPRPRTAARSGSTPRRRS